MMRSWKAVAVVLIVLVQFLFAHAFAAGGAGQAYEAALPPDLATAPDLCALVPCQDVFPGAQSFSPRKGQPPYVEAYGAPDASGKPRLLGYVVLSTDVTDMPAYSGKPVVTLIGMDTEGKYVGVKVLKHSEPILLLGIPESALIDFNRQYLGRSVKDKIEVGPSRPDENIVGVDAVSGATVTVVVQNQVMQLAGSSVARQVGVIAPTVREPARYAGADLRYDWNQLVQMGAVQRLVVKPEQVGLARGAEPFIELWFADLNHPGIGHSLMGKNSFDSLRARLGPDDSAIMVIRTAGSESFKGSGFVRGGIYDRVQVKQGNDSFTFRDTDYFNLYGLEAAGAPRFTESGIFVVRSKSFSPAYPWKLTFLGNRVDAATGHRSFAAFDGGYWLPDVLLEGGRPKIEKTEVTWVRIWKSRAWELVAFTALLLMVGIAYSFREVLTRRSSFRNKWPVNIFKYTAWAVSISWVGWVLLAQPSITQVLTWFHSILFKWQWSLFLSDPFIFLFWWFIIITVFLFGRGLFCGWMCPFGSLSELIYKVAGKIGLARFQVHMPRAWHDRLKWGKYLIFFGLLAVSMIDMGLAEKLAEVEPFKTTFLVGIQNRPWPYAVYVLALLGLAVFVERPFCKYLCPLGAALAMPSTFRWWGLKRKLDCNVCKACQRTCGSLAIGDDGRIDHRECLHCLDCMILYTDPKGCPPLGRERKRRARDGLMITPIDKHGYYIPITPAESYMTQVDPRSTSLPDPRMASSPSPNPPPQAHPRARGLRWVLLEFMDHVWPWSREGWTSHRSLQMIGVSLAIAATLAWMLAATGRLAPTTIIAWWFGWSLFEVVIRMSGNRYVKDGPWWQRNFRVASWMDMLSYVGFKNLMIGAILFLVLKALGMLAA
ncbi:MAG: regulatory protein NosR [Burkholderiales bacterium]|nr:regulatory protein NosR [Burkholderiales bacterium]